MDNKNGTYQAADTKTIKGLNRRFFLRSAAIGGAVTASGLSAPAIAQEAKRKVIFVSHMKRSRSLRRYRRGSRSLAAYVAGTHNISQEARPQVSQKRFAYKPMH